MISTVEKTYREDGTWGNVYKVTYSDGVYYLVPHDTANRHYQEILEWVANGGTIVDNGA